MNRIPDHGPWWSVPLSVLIVVAWIIGLPALALVVCVRLAKWAWSW